MKTVSLCSAVQDRSIDIHIDLLLSPVVCKVTWREVTWGHSLILTFRGKKNTCLNVFRQKSKIAFALFLWHPSFKSYSRKTMQLFEVIGLTSGVNSLT